MNYFDEIYFFEGETFNILLESFHEVQQNDTKKTYHCGYDMEYKKINIKTLIKI